LYIRTRKYAQLVARRETINCRTIARDVAYMQHARTHPRKRINTYARNTGISMHKLDVERSY